VKEIADRERKPIALNGRQLLVRRMSGRGNPNGSRFGNRTAIYSTTLVGRLAPP
jgi:hypothetical protein